MSKVEPLSKGENEEMRDFAFAMALAKFKTLSTAKRMIMAAVDEIDGFMSCHNTYVNDPELEKLKEKIRTLGYSVPDFAYGDKIAEAIGGPEPGAWDYGEPNDEYRARLRDVGIDPYGDESNCYDLPFVDPLDMFKRKSAELEGATK